MRDADGIQGRVVVVGSINVDLVMAVDRLPAPGETVTGGRLARHHGGKSANQAVAEARVGATTVFVGAVGDDDFGREARAALVAEGIDVASLATLSGEDTGVASILVDARGENCIAVASGANAALAPGAVRDALEAVTLTARDVVVVGAEIPAEAGAVALDAGAAAGSTTVLNPAPASGVNAEMLARASVITPNAGELRELARRGAVGSDEELARTLLDGPQAAVLVTLGERGALLVTGRDTVPIDAPAVRAVDTVGAGDTLNGVLAAALVAGLPVRDAAERAVVAASLATTSRGAREGMPTVAQLADALSRPRGRDPRGRTA
jgi:ribokinase